MKVFLTRDGETDWDELNKIQGDSDEPQLSLGGVGQSTRLGYRLKDVQIDGVFFSPLIRAVDAAVQVILAREEYPFAYHDINELKERNAGDFTGMIKPEDGIIKGIPGKSESIEHLRIRAKQAWEKIKEIAQENHYENILVIGHIGINRALVAEILGYEDLQKAKKQHNAALSVYDVPPIGPVQIIVENDVTHLQDIVTTSTADL